MNAVSCTSRPNRNERDEPVSRSFSTAEQGEQPMTDVRRVLVVAGRVLLWAAVALVLVRGVLSIAAPNRSSRRPVVATSPAEQFPKDAALAFAGRFVHDYLSFDAAHADEHRREMAGYLPQGADPMAGWDGKGNQGVSAVIPVTIDIRSASLAVATVAAQVGGTRWLYLTVPVAVSGGQLAIPELPSLVSSPAASDASSVDMSIAHADAGLSSNLRPVVEAFFRAYAAGSGTDLSYFAPAGAASVSGLNGVVAFDSLLDLEVAEGGAEREAAAQVRWSDRASGGSITQIYHLGLTQRDGRWYVERVGIAPAPVAKEKP